MYHFFVADEPPVPQWSSTPPRDPDAIEMLSTAYFDSDYDIRSMLRVLFTSDFFRSEESWYAKVKSPAELVTGVLRLTGEFQEPQREILDRNYQMGYMGQQLLNPPTVEGWHEGLEWIDTGTLIERINFVAQQLGDEGKPGVEAMIERIVGRSEGTLSGELLVNTCLEELGAIDVSEDTRAALVDFASKQGDAHAGQGEPGEDTRRRVAMMLQMVGSTPEFQRA